MSADSADKMSPHMSDGMFGHRLARTPGPQALADPAVSAAALKHELHFHLPVIITIVG